MTQTETRAACEDVEEHLASSDLLDGIVRRRRRRRCAHRVGQPVELKDNNLCGKKHLEIRSDRASCLVGIT